MGRTPDQLAVKMALDDLRRRIMDAERSCGPSFGCNCSCDECQNCDALFDDCTIFVDANVYEGFRQFERELKKTHPEYFSF